MKFQELFPRWCKSSIARDVPWTETYDLADDKAFYNILGLIIHEQSVCSSHGHDIFYNVCEAILHDVLELQLAPPSDCKPISLEYLQFEVSLVPVRMAINAGDFGLTHDWILNGFSDEHSRAVQRVFFIDRFEKFLGSKVPWIEANRTSSMIDWFYAFYYYCWRRAALFETAVLLFRAAMDVIGRSPPEEKQTVDALSMMLNWATGYDHPSARRLAMLLEQIFKTPGVPEQCRVGIAVLFATQAGRFSAQQPREWATWALQHGANLLGGHQPFQLLWTLVETPTDWERLKPQILGAAERYAAEMQHAFPTPTSFITAVDQRSGLLNPAFVTLHRFARGDDFLQVITRWYGVPEEKRLRGGVLFVCPNHAEGTVYLADAQTMNPGGAPQADVLTAVTNRALGLSLTVQGDPANPELPDRLGQPNYTEGPTFARVLQTAYAFGQIDAQILASSRALISFPAYPHPIQALMSVTRDGISLPISSSLEEPQSDRIITRALLWCVDNDNTSAFEIEAIEAVLATAGVWCDVLSGAGRTRDDFYRVYTDRSYDLIWIAGHGAYDIGTRARHSYSPVTTARWASTTCADGSRSAPGGVSLCSIYATAGCRPSWGAYTSSDSRQCSLRPGRRRYLTSGRFSLG